MTGDDGSGVDEDAIVIDSSALATAISMEAKSDDPVVDVEGE